MAISTEDIKSLRERTGISVMQCKKALEEADGDIEKAMQELREQGRTILKKKSERELGAGVVEAYVHATGTIGAMVELFSETDFVARNEEFKKLAHNIAMQASATADIILEDITGKFLKEQYIKDTDKTIADLIQDATQKFGERIELGKVVKFSL